MINQMYSFIRERVQGRVREDRDKGENRGKEGGQSDRREKEEATNEFRT